LAHFEQFREALPAWKQHFDIIDVDELDGALITPRILFIFTPAHLGAGFISRNFKVRII
jgi:hypothetical protein